MRPRALAWLGLARAASSSRAQSTAFVAHAAISGVLPRIVSLAELEERFGAAFAASRALTHELKPLPAAAYRGV